MVICIHKYIYIYIYIRLYFFKKNYYSLVTMMEDRDSNLDSLCKGDDTMSLSIVLFDKINL